MKKINLLTKEYKDKNESKRIYKTIIFSLSIIFTFSIISLFVINKTIEKYEFEIEYYNDEQNRALYQNALKTYEELQYKKSLNSDLEAAKNSIEYKNIGLNAIFRLIYNYAELDINSISYIQKNNRIDVDLNFKNDRSFDEYLTYLNGLGFFKEVKISDISFSEDIDVSLELYLKDGVSNA